MTDRRTVSHIWVTVWRPQGGLVHTWQSSACAGKWSVSRNCWLFKKKTFLAVSSHTLVIVRLFEVAWESQYSGFPSSTSVHVSLEYLSPHNGFTRDRNLNANQHFFFWLAAAQLSTSRGRCLPARLSDRIPDVFSLWHVENVTPGSSTTVIVIWQRTVQFYSRSRWTSMGLKKKKKV